MKRMTLARTFLFFSTLSLTGCGGSSGNSSTSQPQPAPSPAVEYDLSVLMIGNSHSVFGDLPGQLHEALKAHSPDQSILVERAVKSLFLSEHSNDAVTMAHFEERDWDFVILQAQKYSMSQSIEYPTNGAQSFITETKAKGGTPILFPEWAQRGRTNEASYIYDIHLGIAERTPSCIAPVGFAWDNALRIEPDLTLHDSDGNHANSTGSYLTAMVLFQTITSHPAELLGPMAFSSLETNTQMFLQQMATQTIAEYPPCETLSE